MQILIPAFLAGMLTILAPCSVTLLPVILGGSIAGKRTILPLITALSLALSVFIFTLLLKVGTDLLPISEATLKTFGGLLIFFLALTMVFPEGWDWLQIKLGLYKSEKLLEKAKNGNSVIGALLLGAALGPVFSTCSPTYFYILGTVIPADFWTGMFALFIYCLGLLAMLLLVGYGGRAIVVHLKFAANPTGWFKRGLGVILLFTGVSIVTGFDKQIESFILDIGGGGDYFLTTIERSIMSSMGT